MTHELKILQVFFTAVMNGTKRFELRKNDSGFKVGDMLRLREWNQAHSQYTGDETYVRITYILTSLQSPGIKDGYVILSIEEVS